MNERVGYLMYELWMNKMNERENEQIDGYLKVQDECF